ncbi:phosphate ABC transporter permease subunit PstC [Streptomyces sp. RPT161]|uniref:phosphate ABC transporter permease subunit PstC n=1 Tax=Streptomyces sp. RPT161 TaxID=3015993 RepID=UPI0022B8D150|nr:phosphate ABC transporter permease subunit PstC [Streptomyces sp. RPT161]
MNPLPGSPTPWRRVRARRGGTDTVFRYAVRSAAAMVIVVLVATAVFLVQQAWPALHQYGILSYLGSDRWAPSEATATGRHPNPYGIAQFVYGTAVTSLIAMVLAVPVAVAVSLYLTEIAPGWLRRPLSGLVDLLAAIPSVVYGFWGIFALIPAVRPAGVWLSRTLGTAPVIGPLFAGPFFGVSYLVAGLVLAIMILPIITAICREVFATVPTADKESALALGATRWEMVRMAVLPRSRSGITGAAVLGLGRAVGETIAVTMVIGNNVLSITTSILGPGSTMSSVIANEFTESTEPFHLQSLMVVGAWLLVIALVVNTVGKLIVRRTGEDIA